MRPNKLIPLLKPLSIKQLKRLNEFAQSPFFNKKPEITAFIDYLSSQAPRWQEKNLTDEKIFQAVFPHETYDQQKLYYLRSEVIQLIEAFIVYQDVKLDSIESRLSLLKFYAQANWDSQYESEYKDSQKELRKNSRKDPFYYLQHFQLAWNRVEYYKSQAQVEKLNLDELIEYLDIFYLSSRFSLAISKVRNINPKLSEATNCFLAAMQTFVQKEPKLLQIPAIFIPYNLLQIIAQNIEIEQFDATIASLSLHKTYFSHDVLIGFYSVLRNYSITQMNQGNTLFESRALLLYKEQLTQGLLWDNEGRMAPLVFTNILVLALRVKEIVWAQQFVTDYEEKLHPQVRQDWVNYAQAKIAFSQQAYSQVLRCLHQIENNKDVFLQLSCRKLLIQNYFELKEWENVQYQINSFRVFLHREESLSESKKKFSLNFAIIVNQLMQLKEKTLPSPKNEEKIRQMIQEMGAIGEKKWLMAQLSSSPE